MWSIHTVEYSLKRKEIQTHATVWINLEDIMLSQRARNKKTNYMILPTRSTKNSQIHATERIVAVGARR